MSSMIAESSLSTSPATQTSRHTAVAGHQQLAHRLTSLDLLAAEPLGDLALGLPGAR